MIAHPEGERGLREEEEGVAGWERGNLFCYKIVASRTVALPDRILIHASSSREQWTIQVERDDWFNPLCDHFVSVWNRIV